MDFNTAIEIIKKNLQGISLTINSEKYDGIIVKKLEASNTLDDERTTNQTHIAITGSQMDMFPYLRSDGYFNNDDVSLKKYFITRIPITIFEKNVRYLAGEGEEIPITFVDDEVKSSTCIVRSKRQNQAEQIQASLINFDGQDFVEFRKLMHVGAYLVILKKKGLFEYEAFGIKPEDENEELISLNNMFFKCNTNTPVDVEAIGALANSKAIGGINKIFYGAPGCGKSRLVNDLLDAAKVKKENRIRVTFHPEYANCDFIGQILPTVEEKVDITTGEKKDVVKYIFNPGPFTLALKTAYDTNEMVYLIIEEINRGNAAAIFGDMFQLLDRGKDSAKANFTASEYPICNPNMQDYLKKNIDNDDIKVVLEDGVFIPSNLTIYATMNSSDQNVFTLDTAFKRRWSFEQISNDITKGLHEYKDYFIPGTDISWAVFQTEVNWEILRAKIRNQTNEDKRLGKYFVTKDCLTEHPEKIADVKDIAQNFAYKVLEYIWNDVCKIGREDWFDTEHYQTLEHLIEAFIEPKEGETPLSIFKSIEFKDKPNENK